jgi:hypothetical protein
MGDKDFYEEKIYTLTKRNILSPLKQLKTRKLRGHITTTTDKLITSEVIGFTSRCLLANN